MESVNTRVMEHVVSELIVIYKIQYQHVVVHEVLQAIHTWSVQLPPKVIFLVDIILSSKTFNFDLLVTDDLCVPNPCGVSMNFFFKVNWHLMINFHHSYTLLVKYTLSNRRTTCVLLYPRIHWRSIQSMLQKKRNDTWQSVNLHGVPIRESIQSLETVENEN